MIQNAITEIGGVGSFGAISVCLFILVFSTAVVWAVRQKRAVLEEMSVLPLHDGESVGGKEIPRHE